MTTCRSLTVKGQGPEARAAPPVEAYLGKVWITSFDCLRTCETILESTHAGTLVELITQTTKEARGHRNSPS